MAKKKPDLTGAKAEQPGTDEVSKPERPEKATKRRRTTVPHEELVPGTELTATLKGQAFSASVVLGEEGKPEVELDRSEEHTSELQHRGSRMPSSA